MVQAGADRSLFKFSAQVRVGFSDTDAQGIDVLLVTASQTLVLVDLQERKAVPIPESYRERIRAFEGETLEA